MREGTYTGRENAGPEVPHAADRARMKSIEIPQRKAYTGGASVASQNRPSKFVCEGVLFP